MKTVFVAINAKYVHVNLAVRTIGAYCREFSPLIREFSVNENADAVIASLYTEHPDILAFSCYIWNIEEVLYIARTLRLVLPHVKIILGGHEVSYSAREILKAHPYIDYILRGEGEKPMHALLCALKEGKGMEEVPSLTFREKADIRETPLCSPGDFARFPFPYDESICAFRSKIIYYESARGCPFGCTYCLSGRGNKMEVLPLERVKQELLFFIERDVPLVKFVDRTFNADPKRAREIFKFIIQNGKNTTFHFEMAGHLLDDATLDVLQTAEKGRIQFEIGVQTTNPRTMQAIGRTANFDTLSENVRRLMELGNIHVHLDLIFGLPFESMQSFQNSFNQVLALRPHVLQLGFLKLLKGAKIREQAEEYGYIFKDKPPYEVMENKWISFADLIKLKGIETVFDLYYNSGAFQKSMDYLLSKYENPFSVFERIYDYFRQEGLLDRPTKLETRYTYLKEIFPEEEFTDFVEADLFKNPKARVPFVADTAFKEACFAFLKREENVQKYLPHLLGETAATLYKRVRFAKLFGGVYLLENGEMQEVTGDFAALGK